MAQSCVVVTADGFVDGVVGTATGHVMTRAQREATHLVLLNFASDGKALIGNDVPSVLLCYPTRYTHSPIETIDVTDLLGVLRLLETFVTRSDAA